SGDWSSDVCSSDLRDVVQGKFHQCGVRGPLNRSEQYFRRPWLFIDRHLESDYRYSLRDLPRQQWDLLCAKLLACNSRSLRGKNHLLHNPDSCKYEPWKLFSDNDNQLGSSTRKLPLSDRCSRSSYTGQHHSLLQPSRTLQSPLVDPIRDPRRSSGRRPPTYNATTLE